MSGIRMSLIVLVRDQGVKVWVPPDLIPSRLDGDNRRPPHVLLGEGP
jgi:hypothetical protein